MHANLKSIPPLFKVATWKSLHINSIFLEYAPEISKLLIRFDETLSKNGTEF